MGASQHEQTPLYKMVDVPVVQVPQFIDGVDVPVIMQRRGGLAHIEGAPDSIHRRSLRTFLLCNRDGLCTV